MFIGVCGFGGCTDLSVPGVAMLATLIAGKLQVDLFRDLFVITPSTVVWRMVALTGCKTFHGVRDLSSTPSGPLTGSREWLHDPKRWAQADSRAALGCMRLRVEVS